MAIKRIKIDYTVYPPNYRPGDCCWDLRTLKRAKRRAQGLGAESRIYRNFNQTNKCENILGDFRSGKLYWIWTGAVFLRKFDNNAFRGTAD